MNPQEISKQIYHFPVKFQKTVISLVEKEFTKDEKLKELSMIIGNYIAAIEKQDREQDIIDAKSIEEIEDIMLRVQLVSRANKWANLAPREIRKSIKSQLNRFADIIVDYDDFEDFRLNFMIKSNRYHTANDFFIGVENHIKGICDDYDDIVKKIMSTTGARMQYHDKNLIIAWIYQYEASNALGSAQWCISYSENYFNSYSTSNLAKQYFIWDFSKDSTNNKHKIGVTLSEGGDIKHAHFKNDNSAMDYVRNVSWRKFLSPLSNDEKKLWVLNQFEAGKEIKNYAPLIEIFYEKKDINNYSKAVSKLNDIAQVSAFISTLVTKEDFEYFKIFSDHHEIALHRAGKFFIQAHKENKMVIFNFLKNLIGEDTIKTCKSIVEKTNSDHFNEFIKTYENS